MHDHAERQCIILKKALITHTYIYAIRLQCDLHNFMRQYNLDVIISSFKYSMKMNMLLTKTLIFKL
ncbi:hypothetical protein T02_795 [Trichinella nativa]|uniref:Uncharacterized protein n=1 Tax=Trichinella nativa TaxID=6335 RepID=A0A0V1LQ70_9BILA|nr:hypothetical protein T02_795 [Trichinella nativa]